MLHSEHADSVIDFTNICRSLALSLAEKRHRGLILARAAQIQPSYVTIKSTLCNAELLQQCTVAPFQ
jgi:hypothetical protein